MGYLSALAILPKFLWKSIFDYLSIKQLMKLSGLGAYNSILTDSYCKELIYGDKSGAIIAVTTDHPRIDNFWRHACVAYNTYDCMKNLSLSLNKKTSESIHISVFIKPGIYRTILDYYSHHSFNNSKYSLSINGSKLRKTKFRCTDLYNINYVNLPQCFSLKNIVFTSNVIIDGSYSRNNITKSINLVNCIFNGLSLSLTEHVTLAGCIFKVATRLTSIQHLSISKCEFGGIFSLQKIYRSVITKCLFNSVPIKLDGKTGGSIDFCNNTVIYARSIFRITHIENNTIDIHDNTISDIDTFISFYKCSSKSKNNRFLVHNNHLENIRHKYNIIDSMHNIINVGKHAIDRINNGCKIIIDDTNTLTNCGFDTKN